MKTTRHRLAPSLGLAAALSTFSPLVASPVSAREAEAPIVGPVTRVRDGDTLELGRVVVRLHGVAAPERRDPLGDEATSLLRELVGSREVSCEPDGTRSRGRVVAVCRVGGRDVGAVLVRRGFARDCARYSRGRYAVDEAAAKAAGAGIAEVYALPAYCTERPRRRRG